jgi:hypothetical protein
VPTLTFALSKGRIFDETLPLLRAAGIVPAEDPESSRKLIVGTNRPDVSVVIVRASDVPTYVAHGAADIGVAGKDVLAAYESPKTKTVIATVRDNLYVADPDATDGHASRDISPCADAIMPRNSGDFASSSDSGSSLILFQRSWHPALARYSRICASWNGSNRIAPRKMLGRDEPRFKPALSQGRGHLSRA